MTTTAEACDTNERGVELVLGSMGTYEANSCFYVMNLSRELGIAT